MRCLNCHQDGLPLDTEICPSCNVHIPSLMRDILPGTTRLRAGTYQIDYALGRGGFGVTYRGHHTLLEQLVAIKEYFPQSCALRNPTTGGFTIPRNQEDVFERGKQRFLKEGKILARLRHPHVVGVTDLFEENDTAYLVMEFLGGRSLRAELESQPGRKLSPERVKEITGQLVEALAAVHQEGIFHLDVKPDNILLTPEGKSVLIDFGSAKQAVGTILAGSGGRPNTRTFTQEYAAPEVIGGGEVGVESDIFELGMMVYEMLVGGSAPNALLRLTQIDWKPEGLASPWRELLAAALAYNKGDRPKDVKEWWTVVTSRRTGVSPVASPVNPSATSRKTGKMPVSTVNFETVTVNARGEVIKREPRQGEVFAEDLGGGVKLEMVSIPGGSFLMGSPENEERWSGYDGREEPQHRVNVPPFFLGRYPVTQGQYEAVIGKNPSYFKGANRPVEQVSWNDATEFCRRLSQKTRKIYRLPSEAEWEYDCRAGTTTPFYFGETITADLANYCGNKTYASGPKGIYREETTEVGSFPPNAFGLYDMHGNVWEWCQDVWHENYNGAPTDGSAWESGGNSSCRMQRGGSWYYDPGYCRCAYRDGSIAAGRDYNWGFRVVLLPGL